MRRIRIIHKTEYFYNQPVTFGTHRAMMRPREGHDVHIVRGTVDITPKAEVRWLRDNYDNAIANCERAIQIEPQASKYHLWLGRAYGDKADHMGAGYREAQDRAVRQRQGFQHLRTRRR